MVRNYIKVASRNILKRKTYSFINAFGLSIGIAFCILIYLYIQDERSFDQFHTNKDLIYRMEARNYNAWEANPKELYNTHAWLQLPLMQTLKDELPEVQMATRFDADHSTIFRYGEKVFTEKVTYTDADFFSMFSFPLIAGNKDKLFKNPMEVVLTPRVATKYFGTDDPLGKTILLDIQGEKSFTVTGIIESPPANSSLDFQILVPSEVRPGYKDNMSRWGNFNSPTFVQLVPNANLKQFSNNLDKVVDKHLGKKLEEWKKDAGNPVPPGVKMLEYTYTVLPEIHLKKEVGWNKVSDPQYSWILGGIAILILLIACINYVSLALTTSASRRTEVGIRKVVGAQKSQLVYQFGFESVLLSLISMVIGFGLVFLFLPSFNSFTGKGIVITSDDLVSLTGYTTALTIVVGLIAGSYPALFLSGFRPALVLKGRFTSRLSAGFTKPLVVLQFALSAFLIISSLIMYRQMRFITTKDLGFNQEQIVVIPTQAGWTNASAKVLARFRTRLEKEPSVLGVAGVTSSFAKGYNRWGYKIDGDNKSAFIFGVDAAYLPLLGMKLVAGRNFDESIPSDSNAVIVNESLVRDMKWDDPLNEYLNYRQDSLSRGPKVIGVVKDYHYQSLEGTIDPMLLALGSNHIGHTETMLIKVAPGNLTASIEMLRKAWMEISPDKPFDYTFMDEDVARQYDSYTRWMSIMGFSTGFAILISCLGLFGLSGVNAVNRTKEIGIRKVMGAELINIFLLLNKQYVWLAMLAFTLAAPASWYVMQKWMSGFKYTIPIGWELFAISMVAGLIIALATVSYHAIRTSLLNPADTLKYE